MQNKNEEYIAKRNTIQLYKTGFFDVWSCGTFSTLQKIHATMFQDIFPFAGEIRSVNLAKGNFVFAQARYLSTTIKTIEHMPTHSWQDILDQYIEMNIAHPFQEGNGRSMRLWLDHHLYQKLHLIIDWTTISKDDYFSAMYQSPINPKPLQNLIQQAFTAQGDPYLQFLKNLDQSFYYEDFNAYKAIDVDQNKK